MPKTSSRRTKTSHSTSNTKEARLIAAQSFIKGDRIRHQVTGRIGEFDSINLGFALPEVWVQFESDTEFRVPVSCNPLDLELLPRVPSALVDEASVIPEVVEETAGDSPDHTLATETEGENMTGEVRDMAATVDDTPVAAVEVVEELTEDEAADRHRLELKVELGIQRVEKTFYEIGTALSELRDRRLYRSTHKSFGNYCQERFQQMSRRKADYLIVAAEVVDDLKSENNCSHFLPTNESQIRCMKNLTPLQRREAWQTSVAEAGGKIPTARTIKGIVERIKERNNTPPPIPYSEGDVVMIRGMGHPDLRKIDGRWAIALCINEYTVTLNVDGRDVAVKPQFLEEVDPKFWVEIRAVHERITRLQLERDLDPADDAVLEVLRRRTCFTDRQKRLLAFIETEYGVNTAHPLNPQDV